MRPPALRELNLDPLEALGHILSRDVRVRHGVPRWKKAGLDGYAVRAQDTPGELELAELEPCRDPGKEPPLLPNRSAAYVPTGAYLPRGANTLVPLEVAREKDGKVLLPRFEEGRNIDEEASLVEKGEVLLRRGSIITPARAAGLLDAGVKRVSVWEKLRVSIATLSSSQGLRDTTGPLLEWLFSRLPWIRARLSGTLGGNTDSIVKAVEQARSSGNAHVLVLAGRVGPGLDDFFEHVSSTLDAKVILRGVALKGSRPFTVLNVSGLPVLWLPGIPTSAVVSFLSLVLPLMELWGRVDSSWRNLVFRRVQVANAHQAGDRRVAYAVLTGPCEARVLEKKYQRSSSVVSLALASGIVFLDANDKGWERGAWFLPLGS